MRRALVLAAALAATVAVFWAFDRNSHSASDTLRPFLLTMVPVWLLAGLALNRRSG
ncbi:MAG TPA: hypothetical protein VHD91_01325 [Gaiellaceae bacterium]|nr:hypothetical protein [Gaiellaceae bacterium]